MSESFELDDPEIFTAGAVGPPGQRVFYVQARQGEEVCSLKIEKQQVAALAEYLEGLIADLPTPEQVPVGDDFRDPAIPHWTVGTIGVGYDNDADRIVIVVEELTTDEDPGILSGKARLRVTREQVRSFITRSEQLIQGGRPLCPLCAAPMDPEGHACPRAN